MWLSMVVSLSCATSLIYAMGPFSHLGVSSAWPSEESLELRTLLSLKPSQKAQADTALPVYAELQAKS